MASLSPPLAVVLDDDSPSTQGVENGQEGNNQQNIEAIADGEGSSLAGAVFNFSNSIVGAGTIGLGGAIAISGGVVSVLLIGFFAILTKLSLDLVIRLSVETPGAHGSYEDLGAIGLGSLGRFLIAVCKFLYSFGCLVAYIIVVKDNFASALQNLIQGGHDVTNDSGNEQSDNDCNWLLSCLDQILFHDEWMTWILSIFVLLPLCLLRDMTPLASLSLVSVISMVSIVFIVIYLFFAHPEIRENGGTTFENWFQIRSGVLESLGTFVFTFVSQHTVHLAFTSLKQELRTVKSWRKVSTASISIATVVSMAVGVFVYMTFWMNTKSDIFELYPHTWIIDTAKLLLCLTMLLTFPLPFFTCRELFIVCIVHPLCDMNSIRNSIEDGHNGQQQQEQQSMDTDLEEPLLPQNVIEANNDDAGIDHVVNEAIPSSTIISSSETSTLSMFVTPKSWLLPHDNRQLKLVGHMLVTVNIWAFVTFLAIVAPSLGDVLDLVGCATGTMIAFVIPALLSFKLEGYSHLALVIILVGGVVGTVGTYFSLKKLMEDI